MAHKSAVTSSADRILLDNILRASKDLPVDYTAITEYLANEMFSGSLAPSIPFGGDATDLFNLNPIFNVGPGIKQIKIQNFGHQKESYEVIHTKLETDNFFRLRDAGWPDRLIETFLIQKIIIRGEFKKSVYEKSYDLCPPEKKEGLCRQIHEADEECGRERTDEAGERTDNARERHLNLGYDRCAFLMFQAVQSRLDLLGIGYDLRSNLDPFFDDEKSWSDELEDIFKKEKVKLKEEAQERKDLEKNSENEKEQGISPRQPFHLEPRSLHELIRFLGELSRVQLHGDKFWVPEIYLEPDSKSATPLFVIKRGNPFGSEAAISTRFNNVSYWVKESDYNNKTGHQSLRLFTYVRDRLDQAYAEADLPPSNTLILQ